MTVVSSGQTEEVPLVVDGADVSAEYAGLIPGKLHAASRPKSAWG
jgi:hypothetical protein